MNFLVIETKNNKRSRRKTEKQKIKLKKKASKTYSVVGKTVTYVSYRTKDSNPVKTTKKITPTTPTAKPVPYQIANPTPTPEDDPILVSRINF